MDGTGQNGACDKTSNGHKSELSLMEQKVDWNKWTN